MTARKPTAPKGLAAAGAKLWRDLVKLYAFDAAELPIVEAAARTADVVAALDLVAATDGPMSVGSTGQVVVHPAIGEARQQRLALARLLHQLDLPEDDSDEGELPAPESMSTIRARHAAEARWQQKRDANGAS